MKRIFIVLTLTAAMVGLGLSPAAVVEELVE